MIEENELIENRLNKLKILREKGIDPFAIERFDRSHLSSQIIENFDALENQEATVAGRLVALRPMGKAAFAHLQDASGKIQIYIKKDTVGDSQYELIDLIDTGDFLGVKGKVHKTRTGEVTIFADSFQIISKAIRPIPFGKQKGEQEWYGLQDVDQRYRQRYLDLIVNPEVMDTMKKRSRIIRLIRDFLNNEGFMEVETPVLQAIAGGAAARPFVTHHNALDHDFHLRISLELYLKRLIVGGFEKVYEMDRVFRNEGLSTRHSPEYTLLELYQAYANLDDMMSIVERLMAAIAMDIHGSLQIEYQGNIIDFTIPWKRIPLLEGVREYTGIAPEEFESLESAKQAGERLGLPMDKETTIGGIVDKIHERFVQPNLIQPTFITDYPLDISPLAKKDPNNPLMTRRFEPYVATRELGNAFSEINDPLDQRERFLEQAKMRQEGDDEAHPMDEDFLRALEYGMPPTGGLGIGIDRLVMLFTNAPAIRDVILFPQMKPEKFKE